MPLFKTQSCTSKRILLMCKYGYCSIWKQVINLAFTPSRSKETTDPSCLSPNPLTTYFPLPYFPYCAALLLYLPLVQAHCFVPAWFYVILFTIKKILEQNDMYVNISLSPTQTMLEPSDDEFLIFHLNWIIFYRTFMVHSCCS